MARDKKLTYVKGIRSTSIYYYQEVEFVIEKMKKENGCTEFDVKMRTSLTDDETTIFDVLVIGHVK